MRHVVSMGLLAVSIAAGCASPPRLASLVATPTASSDGDPRLVTVRGVVEVPAPLLADNGGALIGKVRIYRVSQASERRPLPGADVHLADVRGAALPGLPQVRTDAAGRFTLPGVPTGLTYVVIAHAPTTGGKRATLRGLAAAGSGEVTVGVGTTMLTSALLNPDRGVGALDQDALDALAERVEAELPASRTPDLAAEGAVETSVAAMLAQDATLRAEVEALKQRLAADALTAEAQRERVRQALPTPPTVE